MKYEQQTKAQLIKLLNERDSLIEANAEKVKMYDDLKLNYQITISARAEDSEKVAKAETILKTFELREKDLIERFDAQKDLMRKDLDGQNEGMINLFEMMDATINLQVLYYNKFKGTFITTTVKED